MNFHSIACGLILIFSCNSFANPFRAIPKRLLSRNSINKTDMNGLTPLDHAFINNDIKRAEALMKKGAYFTCNDKQPPLHEALLNKKRLDSFIPLLNLVADQVDALNYHSKTALHIAASIGYVEGVKALLRKKASTDEQDDYGNTALHLAAMNGHAEVVKELLRAHADVNSKNYRQQIPLHLASLTKCTQTVTDLLNAGSFTNYSDSFGYTPIGYSARLGNIENVNMLIKFGAVIEVKDINDMSELYNRIRDENYSKIVETLNNEFNQEITFPKE